MGSQASSAQPDPWRLSAAALKCPRNASNEPNASSIAAAAGVEGKILGQLGNIGEVPVLAGLGELREGVIGSLDVSSMVLAVVELHDPRRDVRLKGGVVVVEFGQYVFAHEILQVLYCCSGLAARLLRFSR